MKRKIRNFTRKYNENKYFNPGYGIKCNDKEGKEKGGAIQKRKKGGREIVDKINFVKQ